MTPCFCGGTDVPEGQLYCYWCQPVEERDSVDLSAEGVEVRIHDFDKLPPEVQTAMHGMVSAAVQAVFNVQMDNFNNMVPNPDGEFPICKPMLGTRTCERCGRDIGERNGKACPSIPRHQRWSFKSSN